MSNKPRDDFDDDFDDLDDDQDDSDQETARPGATAGARSRPARGGRDGLGRNDALVAGSAAGEGAIHVTDQVSKIFVLVAVGVFVLILLNGLVLGVGGALTPIPTPAPIVTPAPTPKPSITAKPSASAAASPAASSASSAAPSAGSSAAPSPSK